MARKIFFSFHYDDVSSFRANVVRQSWVTKKDRTASFIDKSMWEEAEKKGIMALKLLIENGLVGSSVTVVLVGSETHERRWVKYEIIKSFTEGKGILPIHINRIPSKSEGIKSKGPNPLDRLRLKVSDDCKTITFEELVAGKWAEFKLLPSVNNRKANSIFFENGWLAEHPCGKTYKFSDLFKQEYDWMADDGYNNFVDWIETAAEVAGR